MASEVGKQARPDSKSGKVRIQELVAGSGYGFALGFHWFGFGFSPITDRQTIISWDRSERCKAMFTASLLRYSPCCPGGQQRL